MFDFDKFINRPCIGEGLVEGIFGRKALYIPDNKEFQPFDILVDFHKGYQEVKLKTAGYFNGNRGFYQALRNAGELS